MPPEKVRHERIVASYEERFHGRTRFLFVDRQAEVLPANIVKACESTRGGKLYLFAGQLAELRFRETPNKARAGEENPDKLEEGFPHFERTVRIAWVDLEKFDVIECEGLWDKVEILEEGRVAKLTTFESSL